MLETIMFLTPKRYCQIQKFNIHDLPYLNCWEIWCCAVPLADSNSVATDEGIICQFLTAIINTLPILKKQVLLILFDAVLITPRPEQEQEQHHCHDKASDSKSKTPAQVFLNVDQESISYYCTEAHAILPVEK